MQTPSEHPEGTYCADPGCSRCNQRRATAAFRGEPPLDEPPPGPRVVCPNCGHGFVASPVDGTRRRVTETTAVEAGTKDAAPGDVEYADPGLQADGKRRYPLDTDRHIKAAWSYINKEANAAKYKKGDLRKIRAKIKAAMKRAGMTVSENSITEALINGRPSWDDLREMVRSGLRAVVKASLADPYGSCWVSIIDIHDDEVVYSTDYTTLWQRSYTVTGSEISFGDPVEVKRTYAPAGSGADDGDESSTTTESTAERAQVDAGARVLEARGKDEQGHRIFRVRIIAPGLSKNGRRYPDKVLEAACPLYEGAKAFDRHRSAEEMNSGTVQGLAGYYTDATYTAGVGVEADFHVLPSRKDIAEMFDAALKLAARNTEAEPLLGLSHDVFGRFKAVTENGQQLHEATSIDAVNSVDVVGHPAAGGKPERVVANTPGGLPATTEKVEEGDVKVEDVLGALSSASDEQLAKAGLARAGESTVKPVAPEPVATAPAPVTEATSGLMPKASWMVGAMLQAKMGTLPPALLPEITKALPEQVSESMIDAHIESVRSTLAVVERAGLAPQVGGSTTVTKEEQDRKKDALDKFFEGKYMEGYRSLKHAWADWTGYRETFLGTEDINRLVLRECTGRHYDSATPARRTESINSTTFDQALGDAMYRRMMAMYAQPGLDAWRKIVSEIVPVSDFREQKRERIGGYGELPVVNQGAPYQPLTSPTDEEAVYAVIKRGGTEDLTLESIANDDIGAIRQIPRLLGLAAAITLYRFVFDFLRTNATCTYDSTALFHTNHANTTNPAVLSQATLTAMRALMRQQTAYGDSRNILGLKPRLLIVPPQLEEIAFQLVTSTVAVPSTAAGPSNTPNIHRGLDMEVVDYFATDANDWFLSADTNQVPTIEMGFYQGREDPELFTQADPTVGSMMNADKVTYKIRHIYSGAILDHRGFQRGAN